VQLLMAGLIGLAMASPIAAALDQDPLPTVQLSVELPDQETAIDNPSGLTFRTTANAPVGLRIELFEAGHPESPVSVNDTTALLEIRQTSDSGAAIRLGDMEEVSPGTYETTYVFISPGRYIVQVLPDVQDRSRLSPESTDQVGFVVQAVSSSASGGSLVPFIVGGVGLAALVGVLVFIGTRGRSRSSKPPVPHDTWWNSP
jgi:hypothetical protein